LNTQTGSIFDGMNFAAAKAAHQLPTDFTLAAQAYGKFIDGTASVLTDLITGTQKDWRTATANMLRDIAGLIIKAMMMRALLGVGNFFGVGDLFSFGGATPGRAFGGSVQAGMPYWVGEQGRRELFIPKQDGVVAPLMPGGGSGGGIQMQVNVNPSFSMAASGPGSGNGQQPSRQQMEGMSREMGAAIEGAVLQVAKKHSRPGGMFHQTTRGLGQET
jgi:hypothetical protein